MYILKNGTLNYYNTRENGIGPITVAPIRAGTRSKCHMQKKIFSFIKVEEMPQVHLVKT